MTNSQISDTYKLIVSKLLHFMERDRDRYTRKNEIRS